MKKLLLLLSMLFVGLNAQYTPDASDSEEEQPRIITLEELEHPGFRFIVRVYEEDDLVEVIPVETDDEFLSDPD